MAGTDIKNPHERDRISAVIDKLDYRFPLATFCNCVAPLVVPNRVNDDYS